MESDADKIAMSNSIMQYRKEKSIFIAADNVSEPQPVKAVHKQVANSSGKVEINSTLYIIGA